MKKYRKSTALAGMAVILFGAYQTSKQNRSDEERATPTSSVAIEYVEPSGWRNYGGSLKGDRYASDVSISKESIAELTPAWTFRTGDYTSDDDDYESPSRFVATPILFDGKLFVSTGFNRVFALDAVSGEEVWRYDPKVDFSIEYAQAFTSRGVSLWVDAQDSGLCSARIFLATLDARLIALDAQSGAKCAEFGRSGEIDLTRGIKRVRRGEYSVTSPVAIVGNNVIVGSAIGDNGRANLEEGTVRAFNARTGERVWQFDPIPRSQDVLGGADWSAKARRQTGGGNVWTAISADTERDLVYLPTTSPSPDFYGGERLGDNAHTNSVVALRASSGELVWSYQIVKHDLWDYDLAAQPLLIDLNIDGSSRPALVQATKMGFVFVLDRETGEPLFPVEEIAVPASSVPGELASVTQRFPSIRLHRYERDAFQRWALDGEHEAACDEMLSGIDYQGIFTPPSLEGTLLFPGNPGGVNWGSMAALPGQNTALVAVNRWPTLVKLFERRAFRAAETGGEFNGVEAQFTEQDGTPYGMARFEIFNRANGLPCHEGPWASLIALNLNTGNVLWERSIGAPSSLVDDERVPDWGYFARGGPIITAGGVAFIATPFDYKLSAFDLQNGEMIWSTDLPAQPGATPMAYHLNGTDYVVVAAGGRTRDGETQGDFLLAFKLAEPEGAENASSSKKDL
jgi:quinoprotein glucose dehydrogenase